jgi:hypothetical protein
MQWYGAVTGTARRVFGGRPTRVAALCLLLRVPLSPPWFDSTMLLRIRREEFSNMPLEPVENCIVRPANDH